MSAVVAGMLIAVLGPVFVLVMGYAVFVIGMTFWCLICTLNGLLQMLFGDAKRPVSS